MSTCDLGRPGGSHTITAMIVAIGPQARSCEKIQIAAFSLFRHPALCNPPSMTVAAYFSSYESVSLAPTVR